MIKRIIIGTTNLSDLHQVFKLGDSDDLESKKARLFPTGNTEGETATTSIFLSSLSAVKEYREELLMAISVNKIKTRNVNLHVYTEIDNCTKEERPDGLIVITSGKHNPIIEWLAFVEVKVGDKKLEENQIERYIKFGQEVGINNIITISNEMVTSPTDSPITTKKKVNLSHWSWTYLKVIASRLVKSKAIADEDHVYILTELGRYLDNHKNIRSYGHMGANWKEAVTKVHAYEPSQKIDNATLDILVSSYKQEEKDISLQLMDKSGHQVAVHAKQDRAPLIGKMLEEKKVITTPFIINNDKTKRFFLDTDFIRREIRFYTNVTIDGGKAQAQTSTLLKLLSGAGASDDIYIKALYLRKKSVDNEISLRQLLDEKANNEPYSIVDKSLGDEIKVFEIKTKDLLGRDFQSPQNFIVKIENSAYRFIDQVMENL